MARLYLAGMLVCTLITSVCSAADWEERRKTLEQSRRIAKSCIIYGLREDKAPERLYDLYEADIISPEEVVPTFHDISVPDDFDDQSADDQRAWFNQLPVTILFDEVDYDAQKVAVILRTPPDVPGVAVAYHDAHTRWHTPPYAQLRDALEQRTEESVDQLLGVDNEPVDVNPSDARYRLVLFHGWRVTSEQFQKMKETIVATLERRGTRHLWRIVVVDWRELAGYDPDNHAAHGPARAAANAREVGLEQAEELAGHEKYFVVGHSAGAHAAQAFCRRVKQAADDAWVHIMFLDPFVPSDAEISPQPLGKPADFAVNIRDTYEQEVEEDLGVSGDVAGWYLLPSEGQDTAYDINGVTGPVLPWCHNLDVTDWFSPDEYDLTAPPLEGESQVAVALEAAQSVKDSVVSTMERYSAHHAWPRDWMHKQMEERTQYSVLFPIYGIWSRHKETLSRRIQQEHDEGSGAAGGSGGAQ